MRRAPAAAAGTPGHPLWTPRHFAARTRGRRRRRRGLAAQPTCRPGVERGCRRPHPRQQQPQPAGGRPQRGPGPRRGRLQAAAQAGQQRLRVRSRRPGRVARARGRRRAHRLVRRARLRAAQAGAAGAAAEARKTRGAAQRGADSGRGGGGAAAEERTTPQLDHGSAAASEHAWRQRRTAVAPPPELRAGRCWHGASPLAPCDGRPRLQKHARGRAGSGGRGRGAHQRALPGAPARPAAAGQHCVAHAAGLAGLRHRHGAPGRPVGDRAGVARAGRQR
jgi:hypothetical protein